MKLKLNATTIKTLKCDAGEVERDFWDEELTGFGCRVWSSGARKFMFRYRIGGARRRMSLGPATSETVGKARKTAADLLARVALGEDPARTREVAHANADLTFGSLVEKYLAMKDEDGDWSESWAARTKQYLNEYAASLRKLPVRSVTQEVIANTLNDVAKARGPISANRYRAALSAFFSWVLEEGIRLPEGHPVEHTRKRKENERDRVLSHAELGRIWNACADDDYGSIVKLVMLTACRREEIAGLRCGEIKDARPDLPNAQWQLELKGERIKNGRDHIVPLSDTALAILDRFPREGRETVFGETGTTGFSGYSKAKAALDERLGEIEHWGLHDLRRTAATIMGDELEVPPHVVEAILNHVSSQASGKAGVAGVYNRASYIREKRAALTLWAEHLTAIVEGRTAKVVPLKRGA
jgi:integrase